jgi:hypothetical protein
MSNVVLLLLKIFNSALFQNILSNNFFCFSLMSQRPTAVKIVQLLKYLIELWYQM